MFFHFLIGIIEINSPRFIYTSFIFILYFLILYVIHTFIFIIVCYVEWILFATTITIQNHFTSIYYQKKKKIQRSQSSYKCFKVKTNQKEMFQMDCSFFTICKYQVISNNNRYCNILCLFQFHYYILFFFHQYQSYTFKSHL